MDRFAVSAACAVAAVPGKLSGAQAVARPPARWVDSLTAGADVVAPLSRAVAGALEVAGHVAAVLVLWRRYDRAARIKRALDFACAVHPSRGQDLHAINGHDVGEAAPEQHCGSRQNGLLGVSRDTQTDTDSDQTDL
jgi:hypothetical protein